MKIVPSYSFASILCAIIAIISFVISFTVYHFTNRVPVLISLVVFLIGIVSGIYAWKIEKKKMGFFLNLIFLVLSVLIFLIVIAAILSA